VKTEYYNDKSLKLEKSLAKYLRKIRELLIRRYGNTRANDIIERATFYYPAIIPKIPFVSTPMYDSLLVLNSKMMALKKGMKAEGIGLEEFVNLQIEVLRKQTANIPKVIKKLMGSLYLSRIIRPLLKRVGRSASHNGWPTQVIDGKKSDDFNMKICTRDCQMVNFMKSVGENDLIPYCSFADFTNAKSMGYGLKQTTTIDSGVCTFCFSKKGNVQWPDAIEKVLMDTHV
jgi:hypothetical protein